tara:strand:+ start:180 stop:497 length:318 start_codon:yes stop_codon:yes gene_type:complete
MKKPALRNNRFHKQKFEETNWTSSSKNLGEYIFRRISIDQSDKNLQNVRPRHIMSQLIINSKEINQYVEDYLQMVELRNNNQKLVANQKSLNRRAYTPTINNISA